MYIYFRYIISYKKEKKEKNKKSTYSIIKV